MPLRRRVLDSLVRPCTVVRESIGLHGPPGRRQENDPFLDERSAPGAEPIPRALGVKKVSKEIKVKKPTMATGLLTNFNEGST